MSFRLAAFVVGSMASLGALSADDWSAFRGPSGNGISAEKAVPAEWSDTRNVKWKAALPYRGNGSPIVSNGRVFVTCPEDEEGRRRSLYCFDRKDGKKLWARTVEFAKAAATHATNPHSSSTPVADGQKVVAWHDSAGLYCYDFEGKELWKRDLGEFDHMWGHGVSPILYQGKVILHAGPGKRVFMTALDLATGKTAWETEEPLKGKGSDHRESDEAPMGSWCTPVITKVGGKDQLLCTMPTRLVAYAPDTGKILWWCDGMSFKKGDLSYSSPVFAGDLCVVIGGYNGPGFAVRLGGTGDVTQTHRVWRNENNPQNIGSGVSIDGHLYWPLAGPGVIDCIDPKTGKSTWREKVGGDHWGSAVYAGGRVYATDQKGTTVVFKPSPGKFELVAKNALGEPTNSTPAVSDGQIFIRTFKSLYCIGE